MGDECFPCGRSSMWNEEDWRPGLNLQEFDTSFEIMIMNMMIMITINCNDNNIDNNNDYDYDNHNS